MLSTATLSAPHLPTSSCAASNESAFLNPIFVFLSPSSGLISGVGGNLPYATELAIERASVGESRRRAGMWRVWFSSATRQ